MGNVLRIEPVLVEHVSVAAELVTLMLRVCYHHHGGHNVEEEHRRLAGVDVVEEDPASVGDMALVVPAAGDLGRFGFSVDSTNTGCVQQTQHGMNCGVHTIMNSCLFIAGRALCNTFSAEDFGPGLRICLKKKLLEGPDAVVLWSCASLP